MEYRKKIQRFGTSATTTQVVLALALSLLWGCNATEDLGEFEGDQTLRPGNPLAQIPPTPVQPESEEAPTFKTKPRLDQVEPDTCDTPVIHYYSLSELETSWRVVNYDGEEIASPCSNNACNSMNGQARLEFDVECPGQYRVWIKGLDEGFSDSFYVQLDDTPVEPTIFELGCEEDGDGLEWGALNSRSDENTPCSAEPWDPQLGAGTHTLHLWPRESRGIAQIVVTNDLEWSPEDED